MKKNKKFICIHGHFYQPPRENAWLEMLELQKSAAPFHDWNERITAECYATNAHARILNQNGLIKKIVNNYTHISFNFGPTLLSWMEVAQRETYKAIIEADRASVDYFGEGSALAQVYNHLIMPLANEQDKHTQVIWGIRDFEHRFKRKPKGMWLAETAVDSDTLEVLVDHGIEFTILAPRQAKAIRSASEKSWEILDHAAVDPRRPYICKLKSGRTITLFFYDGHLSQGVAFSGLLNDGKNFARNIIRTLDDNDEVQIAHIATDGESYGHHHKKGEMALADCLDFITKREDVTLCNYATFLTKHPASWEVEIHENSSWSCVHGVERWRSNCGCHTGGHDGWTQAWRQPLRETLDWLRDQMIPIFEEKTTALLKDPWVARNDYIAIVLDRSQNSWNQFLARHALRDLSIDEQNQCRQLLEMQRQAMLLFTSCGWFFDEISGLETKQILQYAHRAMIYAKRLSGVDLQPTFSNRLAKAPSNQYENGAIVYQKFVEPTRVNVDEIAQYFAVTQLYQSSAKSIHSFHYKIEHTITERMKNEKQTLLLGCIQLESEITLAQQSFCYAIIQEKNEINGQVSMQKSNAEFEKINTEIKATFTKNPDETLIAISNHFKQQNFTFKDLFKDQKRVLIQWFAKEQLKKGVVDFQHIYDRDHDLMAQLLNNNLPLPTLYENVLQSVFSEGLKTVFQSNKFEQESFNKAIAVYAKWSIKAILDPETQQLIENKLLYLQKNIASVDDIEQLIAIIENTEKTGIHLDVRKLQELFFDQVKDISSEFQKMFNLLGLKLKICL